MDFRILGPLEVVEEGRPIPIDRRLPRALLAYLLLHANEPVSSDRLIDQLWGEKPTKTAVPSLQNYVSRLRKSIGRERLRLEPAGYVLRVDPGSARRQHRGGLRIALSARLGSCVGASSEPRPKESLRRTI
jgi:DNA-binding SARP family transcriptional activator